MIKINDFIEKGFRVSWTLLKLGWDGDTKFKKQLSGQDIVDFAVQKMEDGDESEDVALLASTHPSNTEEISEILTKLSNGEMVNIDVELRKWRAIYVSKNLPDNQEDYVQGLIELGDIWAMLDFPDDSPHVFQGRNNAVTPKEYYTRENYLKLLERHREWLNKEIAALSRSPQ